MKFIALFVGSVLFNSSTIATIIDSHRNLQASGCPYRSVNINGICQAVSDQCQTWSQSTGECTSCYGGYFLNNGVCNTGQSGTSGPAGSQNSLCSQQDSNGNCTACAYRSVLINGQCQKVSDQCLTWDSSTGLCTSCSGGYFLLNGYCNVGQVSTSGTTGFQIPLCAKQDNNGYCIECVNRAILLNGQCQAVSDLCKTWDTTTGACTSCYDGYNLNNGICNT